MRGLRPVQPPDSGALWLAFVLLLTALVGALALFTGCASSPPISCPLGTYVRRATATEDHKGGVDGKVSLPDQSATAGGTWSGSGSSAWECTPVCRPGTAIKMRETRDEKSLECVDLMDCPRAKDGGR